MITFRCFVACLGILIFTVFANYCGAFYHPLITLMMMGCVPMLVARSPLLLLLLLLTVGAI